MKHRIDSSYVIMHFLKQHDTCSIRELKKVKQNIEQIRRDVYVDVTLESIQSTISSFSSLFRIDEYAIYKTSNFDEINCDSKFIEYFDHEIGESIHHSIEKVFK